MALAALFQYPLVDRVGFEGAQRCQYRSRLWSFSILWWIELVLRALTHDTGRMLTFCFSILWWIELVLRAIAIDADGSATIKFQYPLVDRVGFEGLASIDGGLVVLRFQYPLVDRVGFEGRSHQFFNLDIVAVSVSSGGSSWF